MTAFSLNSSWLASRILLSFSLSSIEERLSFKSKRCWISLMACCTALLTSGRSIFETMSKLLSGIKTLGWKPSGAGPPALSL